MAPKEQDKLHKRDTPDPSRTNIIKEDRVGNKEQKNGRFEDGSKNNKPDYKDRSGSKDE